MKMYNVNIIFLQFIKEIYKYFKAHGRAHLPWRKTTDPYKILVSEIMLQQTQASRVVSKYDTFIKQWKSVGMLAKASNTEVLKAWSACGLMALISLIHISGCKRQ